MRAPTNAEKNVAYRLAKHSTRKAEAKAELASRWSSDLAKLLDCHELIYCVLVSIQYRFISKDVSLTPEKAQLTLTVNSIFKGVDLTVNAVSGGYYSQAHNLIKQEMETIAACIEIVEGSRKDSKTPSVSRLEDGIKKQYGILNSVAHVGDSAALQNTNLVLSKDGFGQASSVPQYKKRLAHYLFSLHIALLVRLARIMIDQFGEEDGDDVTLQEEKLLNGSERLLQEEIARMHDHS